MSSENRVKKYKIEKGRTVNIRPQWNIKYKKPTHSPPSFSYLDYTCSDTEIKVFVFNFLFPLQNSSWLGQSLGF